MNAQTFCSLCNYIDEVLSAAPLRSQAVRCHHSATDTALWSAANSDHQPDFLRGHHSRTFTILPSSPFRKITFAFFIAHSKLSSTPQLAICMHTQKSAVCFLSQHMVPDLYTTEQSQAEAESEVLWVEISIIWFSLPWPLMWWFPSRRGK